MIRTSMIVEYLAWHYSQGLHEIFEEEKNLLWFGYHFFSLPLLITTLFRPIYRIHETSPQGGLDLEIIFENIAVNSIARLVGFFLRITMILFGLLFEFALLLINLFLLLSWLLIPFLIPLFLIIGIQLMV